MDNDRVLIASTDSPPVVRSFDEADAVFRSQIQHNLAVAYRLAAVILGSPTEAEDATQDALEHAWRSRHQLREPDRFQACRDRVRRHRARPLLLTINGREEIAPPRSGTPHDPFAETAERDALSRALDRINVDQRIVIALRFYLDLEIDEIGRRIGVSPGTVKSRLHRGLKELRHAWEAVQ